MAVHKQKKLMNKMEEGQEKKYDEKDIVIPGEVIVKGEDYLPGEWTERRGEEIVATRYGIAEETNRLVKIIPLAGPYHPRKGNVVIGRVENITSNGWIIDIDTPENAFLLLSEVPKYVHRDGLVDVLGWGDMVVAKISNVSKKGIDLTIKGKGLGRIDEGIIVKIDSNKVPRIIGKEGSMINMIKTETDCNVTVGQNGLIWIKGKNIEDEMSAKKAILHISENISLQGLTDKVQELIKEIREETE